jgi:hypothetical protein
LKLALFDEAVRLGLLAFSSHIFLQWQDISLSYQYFPTTYKDCLVGLESVDDSSSRVLLWLLTIGAISVFRESDDVWLKPWIRENIHSCELESWSEMQDILDSFMWIGLVHDEPGKKIFDSLFSVQ